MPRMDGLEVLTQLRGHEHLKRLPVVILSSSREENDLARSWDLGVNAYVVKPVDVDQFFEAVKTLGKFWAVFNEAPQDLWGRTRGRQGGGALARCAGRRQRGRRGTRADRTAPCRTRPRVRSRGQRRDRKSR